MTDTAQDNVKHPEEQPTEQSPAGEHEPVEFVVFVAQNTSAMPELDSDVLAKALKAFEEATGLREAVVLSEGRVFHVMTADKTAEEMRAGDVARGQAVRIQLKTNIEHTHMQTQALLLKAHQQSYMKAENEAFLQRRRNPQNAAVIVPGSRAFAATQKLLNMRRKKSGGR